MNLRKSSPDVLIGTSTRAALLALFCVHGTSLLATERRTCAETDDERGNPALQFCIDSTPDKNGEIDEALAAEIRSLAKDIVMATPENNSQVIDAKTVGVDGGPQTTIVRFRIDDLTYTVRVINDNEAITSRPSPEGPKPTQRDTFDVSVHTADGTLREAVTDIGMKGIPDSGIDRRNDTEKLFHRQAGLMVENAAYFKDKLKEVVDKLSQLVR